MSHNFVAKEVTVHYKGGERALRNFDLDFSGDCLAVVGLSGDGKTTLVNAISGLSEYYGEFFLDGKPISKKPDGRIQSILEDYCILKHKTVRENVEYPLFVRKLDLSPAQRAIEDFGLAPFQDKKAGNIPQNVKPYLAVARLCLVPRDLYVFDDILKPLSNDDKKVFLEKFQGLIKKLDGMKLYVTSNINEAKVLGDKIVILYGGVIEQVGTYEELLEYPLSKRVAEIISNPDFLESTLFEKNGELFVNYNGADVKVGDVERLIDKRYIGQKVQVGEINFEGVRKKIMFDNITEKVIIPY